MSREQPAPRSPYRYADDYEPTVQPDLQEEPVPMLKPFERYMLDGLRAMSKAQEDLKTELAAVRKSIAEIAPHVQSLKNDAALAKKVLTYAKYLAFGLVTRYFPEFAASVAKHAPAVLEAAGKAAGP